MGALVLQLHGHQVRRALSLLRLRARNTKAFKQVGEEGEGGTRGAIRTEWYVCVY